MDLTVAAVPAYFGTMAAEHKYLVRRRAERGPSPADYTKADTRASLTMGVASLVIPLVTKRVARRFALGEGRWAKAATAVGVAAAVATTIADRRPRDPRARQVAAVGGPVALGTAAVVASATVTARTSPHRMWQGARRDLGDGLGAWIVAIAAWDFIYYWNHRFMHEVRALWAFHVVHHSSEHYNLSTALRQPVAESLGVFVPYGLITRLGVRPGLVEQARGVNLLYQYWIHTDAIGRLGRSEDVLNTPSHHRVHHGSNQRYLDRNHGSILIIWDRLFGTFQREDEPVVYGLTRNIETYRPDRIIDHEYVDIVRDVASSTSWRERLSFVFRGPGWAYRRRAERAAPAAPAAPTAVTDQVAEAADGGSVA